MRFVAELAVGEEGPGDLIFQPNTKGNLALGSGIQGGYSPLLTLFVFPDQIRALDIELPGVGGVFTVSVDVDIAVDVGLVEAEGFEVLFNKEVQAFQRGVEHAFINIIRLTVSEIAVAS